MKRILLSMGLILTMLLGTQSAQAFKVYFSNPSNWTTVNAYLYKDAASNGWPGKAMTKDNTTGLYSIDVPAAYESGQVIFTDGGSNQYPGSDEPGLEIGGKAMICCGDQHLWAPYESAAFKVYFDNSTEKWATPYVHYFGASAPTWPGVAMTKKAGDTWEYEVPAGTGGLVFTNGAATGTLQSGDMVALKGHVYNKTKDLGVYQESTTPTGDPFYVYFDNTAANWATPTIHYWGGATESTWPGVAMTLDSGKMWKYQVPAGTTGILFNAGDGDASKTENFNAVADHVYTQSGDQGSKTGYTTTVEMPAALYLFGTVEGAAWSTTGGVALTKSGNSFTASEVTIDPSTAGGQFGYITLVTKRGADWDVVNSGDRYGATAEDVLLDENTEVAMAKYAAGVSASSAKSWKVAAGKYDVTVNFENMTIKVVKSSNQGPVAGEGAISMVNATVEQGKDSRLQIFLNSDDPIKGIQLDVELPSVVTAGTATLTDRAVDHIISQGTVDGKTRIIIYSPTNKSFTRTSGVIVYLPFTAAADAAVGKYDVTMSHIILSDENLNRVDVDDQTAKLTVEAASASALSLNKTQLALQVGESETLVATIEGATGTVEWRSNNTAVATVDATGKVTAVAKGTAIVTASFGEFTANCTVTVGKNPNEITWNLSTTKMVVGEEVNLTATATSGEAVTFVITNGAANAEIRDGKLIAKAVGMVTVQAQQQGNDSYAPAEPVSKTIEIWLGYEMGDVTGDGVVTVADAAAVAAYLNGNTPAGFNAAAADVDGDGDVTVVDITRIINAALATSPTSRPAINTPAAERETFAIEANNNELLISFSNMQNYIATQFEVTLPEGISIENVQVSGSNHSVAFRYVDGTYRVIVLSLQNDKFANDGYIHFTLSNSINGEVTVDNALVDRFDNNAIVEKEANGTNTVVTGIGMTVADENCAVYTMDGVCVFQGSLSDFRQSSPRGMFIIRTAGKAQKMILK